MVSTSQYESDVVTDPGEKTRSSRPFHIVLVNQWYPPDGGWGGTSAYAFHAARAFAAAGHRVTVVTTGRPGQETETDGVVVHRLKPIAEPWWSRRIPLLGPYLRTVRHVIHSWRVSRAVAAVGREHPVDIVEFPEVNAEGFLYLLRPRRARVVIRCHTPHLLLKPCFTKDECYFDFDLIWKLERFTIRRADAVTSPSEDLRRHILDACSLPADRVAVIPHPVPVSALGDVSPPAHEGVHLLHVGRLERAKGAFTLVRAVLAAAPYIPDLHVTFVGAPRNTKSGEPVDAVLKRILAGGGSLNRINFTGYVDQSDLPRYYRQASICVVPSELYESFSYTCAQAMAASRPIIATRTGGIPEVVADGECGLIVPAGDEQALASAIVRLAHDPELRRRMGAAGRRHVTDFYDPERFAQDTLAVYSVTRGG